MSAKDLTYDPTLPLMFDPSERREIRQKIRKALDAHKISQPITLGVWETYLPYLNRRIRLVAAVNWRNQAIALTSATSLVDNGESRELDSLQTLADQVRADYFMAGAIVADNILIMDGSPKWDR